MPITAQRTASCTDMRNGRRSVGDTAELNVRPVSSIARSKALHKPGVISVKPRDAPPMLRRVSFSGGAVPAGRAMTEDTRYRSAVAGTPESSWPGVYLWINR